MDSFFEITGISKSYAGSIAVHEIDMCLKKGHVHCLVGENGAGKSTMVKIISGGVKPDKGYMRLGGKVFAPRSPADAQRLGVVAVQQELSLSPYLPVYQNIWMGHEKHGNNILKRKPALRNDTIDLCHQYSIEIDIDKWISELSLEDQQIVEILKAISLGPQVIILDEPTSAMGASNTQWLLQLIKRLKEQGTAILFISHRLSEVMDLADDITVLKDGEKVATKTREGLCENDIVRMMVGRELQDIFPAKAEPEQLAKQKILFDIQRLTSKDVKDVSFFIRDGEIVGLAGLEGQGQHELMLSLFGLRPIIKGQIKIDDKIVAIKSPSQAIRLGISLVPLDRRTEGAILPLSLNDNIALTTLQRRQRFGWINRTKEIELVKQMIHRLSIKAGGAASPVETLSGGNQQKVVMAKWLAAEPRILLMDDPTRGVDIETRQDIYYHIRELTSEGKAILLNSTDALELVGMCDRVLVMYEGTIVRELVGNEISEEGIVSAAVGSHIGITK
jgi:ribose transport system ATP-binding protein